MSENQEVQSLELSEVQVSELTSNPLVKKNLHLIGGVEVSVDVVVGGASMKVSELTSLKEGEVIALDAAVSDPVTVLINGEVVAQGELVAKGDQFGVCITEIIAD